MDKNELNALIQSEFQLDKDIYYLNHAAVSPLPARSGLALKAFADENVHQGALEYPNWMALESCLRQRLVNLIGSPSVDDIALTKNTSEALSFVAHGFPWKNGDNVVISDEEFPSNRIVWQSLDVYGVSVRQVSLRETKDPEQTLIDACDKQTRLLSISSVQYASGLKMDLEKLGGLCKKRNIAFCVDAIQGLGIMAHHVQEMNIDFLMADGHKWMLGAEGLAVFYCSKKWRSLMRLHEFGWHMTENYHDFDATDWRPANTARCFECGSPNMLGAVVLDASLSLIEEVTVSVIAGLVKEKSEYLFDQINQSPALELITSNSEDRYAGIVVFRHKQNDSNTLYESLMKQKVVCAHRGGGIRFSPHFYTSNSVLDKAIELVHSV